MGGVESRAYGRGRGRPLVGVTAWRRPLDTVVAEAQPLYTLGVDYGDRLDAAGLAVVVTPVVRAADVDGLLDRLDGLVLSGGRDIDPALYGQRVSGARDTDREVDESDTRLARAARARGLPLLAICRGLQVTAVAFGGTLHQEVAGTSQEHPARGPDRAVALAYRHDVLLSGRLAAISGADRRAVTSLHHQAVDQVPEGFTVTALADDGGVEGIEAVDPAWWAVGVQWHPEKVGEREQALFDAFADAVRRRPKDTIG